AGLVAAAAGRGLDAAEAGADAGDGGERLWDLLRGVRGGGGLPVPGPGRLGGAERLHLRRDDAAAVSADGVREGAGARGDVRAAAGLRQLAARHLCAGAVVSAGAARV